MLAPCHFFFFFGSFRQPSSLTFLSSGNNLRPAGDVQLPDSGHWAAGRAALRGAWQPDGGPGTLWLPGGRSQVAVLCAGGCWDDRAVCESQRGWRLVPGRSAREEGQGQQQQQQQLCCTGMGPQTDLDWLTTWPLSWSCSGNIHLDALSVTGHTICFKRHF